MLLHTALHFLASLLLLPPLVEPHQQRVEANHSEQGQQNTAFSRAGSLKVLNRVVQLKIFFELGSVLLQTVQGTVVLVETSTDCAEKVLASQITFVNLPVDGDGRVDRDAVNLSEQLVLVQKHIISAVIARLLERVGHTLLNFPSICANRGNLILSAVQDILLCGHVGRVNTKEALVGEAGVSHVVEIVEKAQKVRLRLLNGFVQASAIKILEENASVCHVVL